MLIQSISETKLDVIGDIHGEISALESLLEHLGYDETGSHPESRKLVFVGDLVDRGENSWAVYKKVRAFIENDKAYCILGNHELNLLITDKNFDDGRPKVKPEMNGSMDWSNSSKKMTPHLFSLSFYSEPKRSERSCKTLRPLPLVIVAPGLRIVHSCWNDKAIQAGLQTDPRAPEVIHDHYEKLCRYKMVKSP